MFLERIEMGCELKFHAWRSPLFGYNNPKPINFYYFPRDEPWTSMPMESRLAEIVSICYIA
jgi:hypothetical protein